MNQKKLVKRLVLKKRVRNILNRVLLTVIIFLSASIIIKKEPGFKEDILKNVYEKNFPFTRVKQLYQKYFGNILSIDKIVKEEHPVFNEKLTYSTKNTYKDGVALTVPKNYMVPLLESGIVVFIGDKEEYGKTVIVEQVNGIDVFYSNVEPTNLKLYDYVEKGELLGEVKKEKLYLVFQKDGKYLNYQDYL